MQALGQSAARLLKARLADLRAADSVSDLPAGSPRTVIGPDGPYLVIELTDGYRMDLVPNHPRLSSESLGNCDWTTVRRLKIISVSKE